MLAAALPFGLDDRSRGHASPRPRHRCRRGTAGAALVVVLPAAAVWARAPALGRVRDRAQPSRSAASLSRRWRSAPHRRPLALSLCRWRDVTDPGALTAPVVVALGLLLRLPSWAALVPTGPGWARRTCAGRRPRGPGAAAAAVRPGTRRAAPAATWGCGPRPRHDPAGSGAAAPGSGARTYAAPAARPRARAVAPRPPVSSTGFDLLHAALSPGKQAELDERRPSSWCATTRTRRPPRSRWTWPAAAPTSGCRTDPRS